MIKNNTSKPQIQHKVLIESLSHEGRGIGRINGKTVFVHGALPGETVTIKYIRRKRKYDEAVVLNITNPSDKRVIPECQYFELCGGCSLQHMHPDFQISHKQDVVLEQLSHIGNVKADELLPTITGAVWEYRQKARLGVKYVDKKQKVLVGFREKRKPSYIADIDTCKVLNSRVGKRISSLKSLIDKLSIKSKIPQIEVAAGDEITAVVIRHMDCLDNSDLQLLDQFSQQSGIRIYLQPGNLDSVRPLNNSENTSLSYSLPQEEIIINFSPMDFTQVNFEINQKLVQQVLELLELNGNEEVMDLFCGLGNFTFPVARKSKFVTGLEGSGSQVERARKNAEINNISNVEFKCVDLYSENSINNLTLKSYNKVILDPPRSGAKEILDTLNMDNTERMVYVSCNPATLARDAGLLVHNRGYKLTRLGIIDMFPHTAHVESVAVFDK